MASAPRSWSAGRSLTGPGDQRRRPHGRSPRLVRGANPSATAPATSAGHIQIATSAITAAPANAQA